MVRTDFWTDGQEADSAESLFPKSWLSVPHRYDSIASMSLHFPNAAADRRARAAGSKMKATLIHPEGFIHYLPPSILAICHSHLPSIIQRGEAPRARENPLPPPRSCLVIGHTGHAPGAVDQVDQCSGFPFLSSPMLQAKS